MLCCPVLVRSGSTGNWFRNIPRRSRQTPAYVVLLISDDLDIASDYYDDVLVIPKVDKLIQGILTVIPLQLMAYEIARLRGCEIDQPRNLAKSVTVE